MNRPTLRILTQKDDAVKDIEAIRQSIGPNPTNAEIQAAVRRITNESTLSLVTQELNKFITEDERMIDLKFKAETLADKHDEIVLITGPTGTGKEILARAIAGLRTPFIPINMATFTRDLIASELFGHVRGSFTGATEDRPGILVAAEEGTVLLDEIGSISLPLQSALLRVVEERKVRPVGSSRLIDIKCRILFSTKFDLEKQIKRRQFLEDLYGRIFAFELRTTSLKERPNDIMPILKSLGYHRSLPSETDFESIWKYNVRALQAIARRERIFNPSFDDETTTNNLPI